MKSAVFVAFVLYLIQVSLTANGQASNATDMDYFSYEDYFSNEELGIIPVEISRGNNTSNTTDSAPTTSLATTPATDASTKSTFNNETTQSTATTPSSAKPDTPQFYNVTFAHISQIMAGEALNITVIVQNYMKVDFHVNITQDNHESRFMNVQLTNDFVDIQTTKELRVPPKSIKSVQFALKTWKSQRGPLRIDYRIESKLGKMTRSTKLLVRPEGAYHESEHYYYVDLENAYKFSTQLDLYQSHFGFQADKLELHGYGNAIYPLLPYLNTTVEPQTAEQAMSAMLLNHIAFEYLKISNRLDVPLEIKLKQGILDAYEQLIIYLNMKDGSISNFLGKQPSKGSTWLTAYVITWLLQFDDHLYINSALVDGGVRFLLSQQADDGRFMESGDIFNKKQNCSVALTAHVILALLEHQKNRNDIKLAIEKGLHYIHLKLNSKSLKSKHAEYIGLYSKAIATFALHKTGHNGFKNEFSKLKRLAKNEGEFMWWAEDDNDDMESTAYMLLATLATRDDHWSVKDILPILKWLVSFGNVYTNSVLYPTKSTVTGLMAIIEYEKKFNVLRPNMTVHVKTKDAHGEANENELKIDDATDNKVLKLATSASDIQVLATGKGTALAQISHGFFLMDIKDSHDFTLTVNSSRSSEQPAFTLKLNLCLEYNNLQSNLLIVVVPFPTGYTVTSDGIQQIYQTKGVKLVTIDSDASVLKIFIVDLQYRDTRCASIKMKRLFNIACQRPIAVYAYEYNDLSKRDIKYLELSSTLCDLCEKDRECKKHCKTES